MKTILRIFAVALIIAGVAYGAVAILMLFNVEEIARLLDFLGTTEHEAFGFMSIDDWKRSMTLTSWFYLVLGITACVCGVGIFKHQEWARLSWLIVSVALSGLFLILVVQHPEMWSRYIELLVFAIPSFIFLSRKPQWNKI